MANPLTSFFLDPVVVDRDQAPRNFQLSGDVRWWAFPLGLGIAALAIALVGIGTDATRFWYAYLVGWVFCVSIAIGCLFFVMIQHITKARWSVTIRRVPELMIANFPALALLGLPILLFGMHDLFHWTHADLYEVGGDHYDPILAGKQGYLNMPFFVVRFALYFGLFSFLGRKLYRYSVLQDTKKSAELTKKQRFWSGAGIPLSAIATAFFGYDYLMSLDPHWFSTMFGVYFFAGGWLACLSLIALLVMVFRRAGVAELEMTKEHIQDVGKFMFAFVVFWAYIAFSQYMLIWYGNLPEETQWFADRFTNGWDTFSWTLLLGHFAFPFFALLPRFSKRVLPILGFMAIWLLFMHWVDLIWLSMPTIAAEAAHTAAAHAAEAGHAVVTGAGGQVASLEEVSSSTHASLTLTDFAAWIGMFGTFLGLTLWRAGRHAITAYGDPFFTDSIRFENV
ncbi:MAG: hypothetical protein R3284_10680 [Rubricoccaceae bacterium]|nr:hypothetical protein [Rubricoccaceae bacterium]